MEGTKKTPQEIAAALDYDDEMNIISPQGIEYRIRRLEPYMFLDKGIVTLVTFQEFETSNKRREEANKKRLETGKPETEEEKKAREAEEQREAINSIKRIDIEGMAKPILVASLVSPKFVNKRKADCQPGEMSVDIIVKNLDEMIFLLNFILKFSSSVLMGGPEGAAMRFRNKEVAGNSGWDGDEIRNLAAPDNRPGGEAIVNGEIQH
jgi:hypothetical protein